jgi:hypothetical protein
MNSPRTTRKLRDAGWLQWILLLTGSLVVLYYFTLRPAATTPASSTDDTASFASKMSACIVAYAPESDFPIQNLPYGVFARHNSNTPHIGVAIGSLSFFVVVVAPHTHTHQPTISYCFVWFSFYTSFQRRFHFGFDCRFRARSAFVHRFAHA